MKWQEIYKNKLMTPQDAAKIVQTGDCVWMPLCLGQPSTLVMDAIADRKDELRDIELLTSLNIRPFKLLKPEYRDVFILYTQYYSPLLRQYAKTEWANYLPWQSCDAGYKYSHRKRLTKKRTGIILQVAPPDNHGFVNLGLDLFWTEHIMDQSEWIIAEVNPQMPRTCGQSDFHVSRFAAFVENSTPITVVPTPAATDVEIQMAKNVVSLLKDRDCIQVGIGAVPAMISQLLENSDLKDLGVHTEMAPAGINRLVEKGIVTGKYKKTHKGKIVMSFAMGDQEVYDFVADNPMCEFRPTKYANSIAVIGQEDNVVAINGSIEVDLTGQICSESIGKDMYTGSGGQLDFVVGSFWSDGGRAVNLVPSTANNDSVSRIVPYLKEGTRITVPRQYAGYIVT